jgi:glyoxylase-like metal-dependent hydrolase (beta-lactamase superfamily II)
LAGIKGTVIPVTPLQQNCSVFWDDEAKRATVVDPGGDAPEIVAFLETQGLTVEQILLTHGHFDHTGGVVALNRLLEERQGAPVPVRGPHRADAFLLEALARDGAAYGIPEAAPVAPDEWLDEGGTIEIAGQPFAIYHCPGHSPGSLVYVNLAARFAIVGDVLFNGSIGRTDFPYGDHAALIGAIRSKLFPLGDDISFICGHGPGSTFGAERMGNPFAGDAAQ